MGNLELNSNFYPYGVNCITCNTTFSKTATISNTPITIPAIAKPFNFSVALLNLTSPIIPVIRATIPHGRPAISNPTNAVSYTHLTLPTTNFV